MSRHDIVMVPAERLDRLEAVLERLATALANATVTPAPEWCSIREAARRLGCSDATIRRRVATGAIEARGNGKLKRVKI